MLMEGAVDRLILGWFLAQTSRGGSLSEILSLFLPVVEMWYYHYCTVVIFVPLSLLSFDRK
jgi:hypothetical protein